jgi:hypothetical protein
MADSYWVVSVRDFDEVGVTVGADDCHGAGALRHEHRGERSVLWTIGCTDGHEVRSLGFGSQLTGYVAGDHADGEVRLDACGEHPSCDSGGD